MDDAAIYCSSSQFDWFCWLVCSCICHCIFNTAVESLKLEIFSFKLLNTSRIQILQIFSDSILKIYLEHVSTL